MDTAVTVAVGAAIALGLVGTIVPRIPGVVLIWSAVLVWAAIDNTAQAWTAVAVATVLALADYVAANVLAGRPLADTIAPARSVAIGIATGAAGLLLARTLGMVAGFAFGTYLAERRRLRHTSASPTSGAARSRAAIAIDIIAGLLITGVWLAAFVG